MTTILKFSEYSKVIYQVFGILERECSVTFTNTVNPNIVFNINIHIDTFNKIKELVKGFDAHYFADSIVLEKR